MKQITGIDWVEVLGIIVGDRFFFDRRVGWEAEGGG